MKILEAKKGRLPDEIIIITGGRKQPILDEVINEAPRTAFVYVDDSVSQLEKMLDSNADVKVVRGLRHGTKRSAAETNRTFQTAQMEETRHTKILDEALSSQTG
jgi:hypothetical protein